MLFVSSRVEMNYEMLAEIDDEIGDLHILDTANTVSNLPMHVVLSTLQYKQTGAPEYPP